MPPNQTQGSTPPINQQPQVRPQSAPSNGSGLPQGSTPTTNQQPQVPGNSATPSQATQPQVRPQSAPSNNTGLPQGSTPTNNQQPQVRPQSAPSNNTGLPQGSTPTNNQQPQVRPQSAPSNNTGLPQGSTPTNNQQPQVRPQSAPSNNTGLPQGSTPTNNQQPQVRPQSAPSNNTGLPQGSTPTNNQQPQVRPQSAPSNNTGLPQGSTPTNNQQPQVRPQSAPSNNTGTPQGSTPPANQQPQVRPQSAPSNNTGTPQGSTPPANQQPQVRPQSAPSNNTSLPQGSTPTATPSSQLPGNAPQGNTSTTPPGSTSPKTGETSEKAPAKEAAPKDGTSAQTSPKTGETSEKAPAKEAAAKDGTSAQTSPKTGETGGKSTPTQKPASAAQGTPTSPSSSKSPPAGQGSQQPGRDRPGPQPGSSSTTTAPAQGDTLTWIAANAVTKSKWRTSTGKGMRKKAKRAIPKLAGPLTSGGFPAQPVDAKKQIGKRFPKGKLFSDAEWEAFKELSSTPEGRTWLNASGMLTHSEIEQYLSNDNPERFRGFHLLHKPSKVVMASYVSRQMNGGEDGKRFEGTPPAAIALSMEARHTTDPARKEELTRQIDQGIVNEWVKTFEHTKPNADTIKAMDQSAVLAPRTLMEKLTRADIKTLPTDEALARHRQSIEVLKNIFHLLQAGAEIYDAGSKKHVPLQGVPVAKLLSHGGRVNIQVPKGSPPYALTEFLGITDKNGNPTTGVFKREFGTHHMALSWGKFKEEGGRFAMLKSMSDDTELYGMNPAIGGLGLKDFNGDIILPDGAHGHVFIGYRPPKPGRRGALQIGMETTGPGAPSTVGYVHNARSTEKTANPISSVGGLKQDKIGDEKGKNARTVDLHKFGDDWVKTLKDRADQFEHDFEENPTEAIKDLVGPRELPPQDTHDTAPLASDSSDDSPDDSPDDAPDDSSDAGSDRSERDPRGGDRRGPPGDATSDPKRGAQDPGQGSSDQRPRGDEQAPKGNEPREMPGDAPEQMTAKTPEASSPRPEAGTTQSAPGKAPEIPGQPRPETTSRPSALGPEGLATAITAGTEAPAASAQGSAAASATPNPGTLSSRDDGSAEKDIDASQDEGEDENDSRDEVEDDSDDEGKDEDEDEDESEGEGEDDSDDEDEDDSEGEGEDDSDDEDEDDSEGEGEDDSDDEDEDDSEGEGEDDSDDEDEDDSDDDNGDRVGPSQRPQSGREAPSLTPLTDAAGAKDNGTNSKGPGDGRSGNTSPKDNGTSQNGSQPTTAMSPEASSPRPSRDDDSVEEDIENTSDLVVNALPDNFVHDSMVTFGPTNVPRPLASPKPTQAGIERILDRWGFSADVFFKRDLGMDGLTRPDEDPDIGPGPFESTVFPAGGFGVPVTLPPELVELRVALTIAHELSHANQYDNLDLIDLEGREAEIDRLPPLERDVHQTAFERQKAALEVVGYQSEIVNLERFRKTLNDDEAKVYHDGLQAMEDQARTRRDEFFDQLTPEQQAIFIHDGFEAVLENIQRGLDVKFFRNNAPDADEEDAGDEDQNSDDGDEDHSDVDSDHDDSEDEDDSDDEGEDDSDDEDEDEGKDDSDDEGKDDSDDEGEDDSDDEGDDNSKDESDDDSEDESDDDSDDEGDDDSDDEDDDDEDDDDDDDDDDDSDDEGDDDSEDHNGDRAGPSQRPQSGGQPRPETTSQPPAQRSATPATAITTGMQAPTRPPASTKVGWLGKKLGTGGHGLGGMISNEGADQREQALADQYALQIGPDEDTGGAHFSHKMLDHIEKALGDLPPEHVTGSPTLRKIIRDISSEQAASAYDELTDTINIVNPPKVPTFIYSRLNRRWNWQRKRMDRGALRDYDGVNKEQDRALGITEGRHVMGGTSDVLANGSLIKWTMRHEIGHSIDKLIDWKGNLASDPRFGGWKVHSDTRDTEEVARAILDKAGITDDEANSETDGVSLLQRFASFLHAPSRRKDMTPLEDFPDDAASEDPGLKKKLEKAVDTVKFAMAQPWTLDDGGASRLEVDGRIYQVDHYDQWVSYSADARNNAVSNYQFSTPAEWFAETYASYYDPNPAPRAQLTQQVRDFFANDLSGLVTSGQEKWERINENTRKAEEGIGPQPPQPPAGSSASPSAVSPSAVTAGMSRNITTGTPSSGSLAASPPRDATSGPQGSSPRDANGGSQASPPRDATRAPNDSAVLETDGAREGSGNTQAALQALIDASKTWAHPANPANKQEAKELLGDIMRSQGVDRSLVDRLAELIDAPDSLSQHEFAICALQSVLRTQLTSDLAGFARVVAAEFTGKLFDRDGKQIADFSLDNQGEHRATTSPRTTDDPIQSVIRGDLPLNDAPIGNKLLQNGVKKAGAKRADFENKGRAWSDTHVLDYLLARGLGKMLSTLAPEQYKADAKYTAGVKPGYLGKAATRGKDAKGPSKKLGDLQLSADSLVTIFTNILGGDAQTMVDGDNYDVDRINDALARPEQAPFAVATFLDGNGLLKRADQSAKDPTKVEPFDKAVTSGASSAHQVVINGKITEDGDHYVVPLHTWQQSFSIKVKKDLLPSLFPVFTYGTYLPSQSPGTNDPARSQAPKPNAWTQLTTGGGDPLGTGGHGLAGLVSNKGAAEREQALADQYELQIGPDEDADGTHFSHKMLAHIEKALSELPPTHITGSPTLRKIIRTLSSEQAASEYDEETDTINIVNPPKVPTFIYSRLNRRWDWQRKRMDRGALRDYPGVSKEQDEALGIVGRRQVMGGVSDVLANGNLLKWTIRHEVAHSIDKLVDWRSRAHEDRFGGWQEHADSRELQAVARAIFHKAGISDDKAQQKLDDEGQSDPNGFPLIERFASLLDPELRRKDMTPLESFPAKVASTDPDLKDRLDRAVRTVKIAMAQPWTLSDGGSRELEVDGRIYHVDPYNAWVSYRADARNNAVSNYQFSTPKEWFAETYASYHDPDPAPRDQLTQEVRDFFRNELPDLVTAGRASWQRIRENIARSAGNRPGPSAITTGFNPAASADPNSLGEGQTSDPADMLAGYNPASDTGDETAAPRSQLDEIQEEPEPPSERAPDPATSTPVEEVTWIVDKAVKNTIWRTDTGPLSRDRAKQGLSAIQGPLSASGFPPDPTTAKEQLGGRFPGGPLFSDAEWSAFVQLSSTAQGQTWLNASGMLTHEQVEQYLSGNDDDNPERFRGFDKLHNATKVVLASYVSRQMNGGEDGKRFEGTPPAAVAISMEARHTTDPARRAELKRLIDQGILEEWSKTFEYTQPNEAATTAINKGAVLAPKSLLNTVTFTKGKELSKAEVIKRHGQSLEVLKNVFHLLQEGAEIYDADAKSHVPLQDVPVAKLLSHGGRVNVQIPPSSSPYALTEHLGITDSKGKPRPGVFKRFAGTHHVSFADGEFKEEGGHVAAIKAKLDDTELYGINLAVGGLGLKDFNGDVILPDGAHGHLFIGYRPPKPGRPGALQLGLETTGPNAPSTVGYVHNLRSTEKTANPISSVGGLKQDKIGDESTKNARTVDLGKLGSDWRKTLKDRADRFEQDLKQKGKDALTELLGPRTQPPQELQDAQQRSGEPDQAPRDNERRDPPGDAPVDTLAGYNPASDSGDEAADPQPQTDEIQEEPEPASERAPDPATSTPVEEVTWIVDKAVKNTIWRPDTGFLSREKAKRGLPAIAAQLSGGGFPRDPGTAKEQLGGRFSKGQLLSDAEWSAFEQLSSTPQGQSWLNASGMLTLDEVKKYLSGKDEDNPERFRGFHQLHKASKVVLASYVSRQMNGGEDGKRFEGTPPAAVAISMEARHTTDPIRKAELERLIDQGIVEEWSKTLEYTEPNDDANTAIDKGAVLDPKKKFLQQPKKLSKQEVVDRHRQSLDVLKNVFHLLQEGAEIYDDSAKSHVPLQGVPVAKLLSHGGRVNVQVPAGGAPYELTELLGITDKHGNPRPGVFKRSFGTHHVSFADGEFKEEGGHFAAVKSKLDDTELYGINLTIGGLGLKDFNGDVIVPDGAHGHMFIGYRPPRPGRQGALQIGIETTGPGAPSTVGYVHNVFSTEKTANPISSVGGLKQDKIGDDQIKNARTVDLSKLGSNWAKTLRDRADRFEQDLALRGKDALTELVGPRTQPPHELQDAGVDRSGDTLAGAAAPNASPSPTPTTAGGTAQVEPSAQNQEKTLDELLDSLEEQSRAWSHPATAENKRDASQLLTGLLQRQNVNPSIIDRLRELIDNPASLSQSAFTNCALTSILYPTLKNDLATTAHLVAAIFTGKPLGKFADSPRADSSRPQGSGKGALNESLDLIRRVMTGEVPQALGPAPTRPLVNGLRTAKAKSDSLKRKKDREELERHLLDHLLARGLVELLGPDALAKLQQQTDGAHQPGVAAAQGDLLASANSVASILSSALGANATVMTRSSPGGYDVARLNGALRQKDQAGFAIATVMDGKALWSAAKEHEASSTTPDASENVARLGGTATTAPHHATIDGSITDQGDSFLVPLQSWGRTFPVRVNKEDMPKVFAAITYGTALPPRAPSPTASAQEQTLADLQAGHNPDSDSRDETAAPQPQTDEIQEEPEPASERAPDPATSTPVEEVTWIVDKAVKNTIWRPDTGFLSREKAKRGLPAIAAQLSGGGFPRDPGTAKEQLGGRFSKGQLLSDAEWSAFEQLSSTPQGQSWLNASGMLTLDEVKKYLSGKDEDNPERFRGFHQLHKASKVVLASYVSRQMNGGEDGKRFEGTPPAAVAISMEARHTTDPIRKAELERLIDQGIVEEWSKTLEYTEPNDDANTAIDKGAVLDPKKKFLQQPKKLSKQEVVDRHRQSLDVLKNVFHLLQEGAEIYDDSAKSHVPLQGVPVAKLLSHGGRVNVQVPAGGAPYELTELLGITDKHGNPRPGVFKRSFGTHHVSFADGEFKEEGGHFAAVKSKLDDTELYGINLTIGGLGLKDFNGDVIVPDGAHGHMFIGYRPPRPGRQGALQIGIETTGPGAPSTVGYVHNVFSTEKTANPISSVGGLKQDKIGDDQIKNARTVDLSKLGSNWAKTLRDRADRFEQDLALRGKDALTELVGPRTQPPHELQDAQQRSGEPAQEPRDNDRRDPPGDAAADMLAGYNPASDTGDETAAPRSQLDEIQEEPEPPSERAPDPATSTPVEEVTWIVDKAVKNTIWRTDTGPLSRDRAKQGLSAIQGPLSASGFPPDPTTAKEQLGGRFPGGPLFSDAEWSAFVQLSSTAQGQTWLNASGMLTHEQVEQYLSGNDDDNPERFRGFDKLHNATKVVLASYVSRQMNGGEDGKRFEGTPPAAVAISMEARHTTDPARRAELKRLIDQGILEEWSKTFEYTQPNEAATTAINKGAVLAPKSLLNTVTFTKGKELSKAEVIKRHGQSLEVLKNVFHLLQEGAEIYDADAKSHVPLQDVPVAKLLSHGGRVNVQIPPSSSPYALTEHLGITDSKGKPRPGVFKRFAGTHHVSFADGEFKEEGGHVAAIKAKLDDTELYGINLAVGGLGLKDFNGDVILPDGAHGHLFIGYRPPKPGRPGALQLGMETTGPNAPSTVGYVHNLRSTEKTANPISSVGGLKQDKIGDESTKNARTVDLGKLGSDWRKTLKDRADRFEQDLKQKGKDALTELLGPRTQPPQELQDAQQRSGEPDQAPRDNEPGDAPAGTAQRTGAPANVLAGYNPALDGESVALDPQSHTDSAQVEPSPRRQDKTLDELLSSLDEQSRAWSGPPNDDLRQQAANSLAGLLESLNVDRAIVDRLRELIENPASLSQSAFSNCGLNSALYTMLKGDLATTSHLVAALFTGRLLGQLAQAPGARELGAQQDPGTAVLSEDLDTLRRVMTGEIPRALGPAPTRPLINGLKTAGAKRGGLTRAADRQQLDRHLLDHLLARGLVELLGQDAVAQHGKRTDDARQPGAVAAQGDVLLSANSIATLMSDALGAEVEVMSGGPSEDDIARLNETLRRTDRAGFAVATVSNGKALWEAAKQHRDGDNATPRAPATVAPLGTGEAQSRHHFAIDGEIKADGDAFIVPVQSWGQAFPIRVQKADMPRLFEAITHGTYPPPRAPARGAPTQQQAPVHLASRGRSGTAVDAADPRDQLAGTPTSGGREIWPQRSPEIGVQTFRDAGEWRRYDRKVRGWVRGTFKLSPKEAGDLIRTVSPGAARLLLALHDHPRRDQLTFRPMDRFRMADARFLQQKLQGLDELEAAPVSAVRGQRRGPSAPAGQGAASAGRPAVAPGRIDPGTVQLTPSRLYETLVERVPEQRLIEVASLAVDIIDSQLIPQLLDILPITLPAAARLAEELIEKWLVFNPSLLDLPAGELRDRLAAYASLVLGTLERDQGRSTIGRDVDAEEDASSADEAPRAAAAPSAPQPREGTLAPREGLEGSARESSSNTSSRTGSPGGTTPPAASPAAEEDPFGGWGLDLDIGFDPEEHKQQQRAAQGQVRREKLARENEAQQAIPDWIWDVPHYSLLQTALLDHINDDAVRDALTTLLPFGHGRAESLARFLLSGLNGSRTGERLAQAFEDALGMYKDEARRRLAFDLARALGAIASIEEMPGIDLAALREPPPPPPPRDEEPPRSVVKRGHEGRWVTRDEIDIINRSIGERAFAGMLARAMDKGKVANTRAIIEHLVRHAERMADPALSPPLTSTSLVVDSNLVGALLTPPGALSPDWRHIRDQLDELIRDNGITDLRLANINVGELFQHGDIVGRTFTTQDGREIPWYGIRLDGHRRDDMADYELGFDELTRRSVGEKKGSADRSMVADAFFSERAREDDAPAVPHFATSDHGVLTPLLSFAGIDAAMRAQTAFTDFVKENTEEGTPYFRPQLMGRELKAHAILNLEAPAHAAAEGAAPAESPPIGASLLDTPVGTTHRVHDLIGLIRSAGFDVYIVGGAVRDALSDKKPKDVDLKTNMPMSRLEAALRDDPSFRSLSVSTVPDLRLITLGNGDSALDITTADDTSVPGPLDVMADALKRDFRMNAIYLDERGYVKDPLNGIEDQLHNRLRFVADPGPPAPVEERQRAVVEHLRKAPWNLGRALKFHHRGYKLEPEILHAVRDNAESILSSMAERNAPLLAKSLLLHSTRVQSPDALIELMEDLRFSARAIRELIPDEVAGRFDDDSLAYERDILPRWRDTPDDNDAGYPLAAPEMKVDVATGRIYQYRIHAKAPPQQEGQPEEHVIIDVDLSDHNQAGHNAPHYHVYRWRKRDGQSRWDKKKNGFSDTGQPGLPLIDGGFYLGPQPWRFDEGLDSESSDFLDVAARRINEAGIQLTRTGDQLDLGGQVKLHAKRLRELHRRGQFSKLLMLVKNLNDGIPWSAKDQATVDLAGSHRGQERLRFKPQLDQVVPFLRDSEIVDPTSIAIFAEDGQMRHDALLRLYDLVSADVRQDLRRPAATYALKGARSVDEFVERFEFYVASMQDNLNGADIEARWQAHLQAAQEAGAVGDVTLGQGGELTERLAEAAGQLRFESASTAAYHAAKHGSDFLTPEELATPVSPADGMRRYLETAREAVRKASVTEARTDETGATNVVLWHGATKVVARVRPDGTAHLLTSYVHTGRNAAPTAAFAHPTGSAPTETGVQNIGNSCFLSAGLTMLARTDAYYELFAPREGENPAARGPRLRAAVRPILDQIRAGTLVGADTMRALDAILTDAGVLEGTSVTTQQDPSEVLRRLFRTAGLDTTGVTLAQTQRTDWTEVEPREHDETLRDPTSLDDNLVWDEPASDILLSPPSDGNRTLQQALDTHFGESSIEATAVRAGQAVIGNPSRQLLVHPADNTPQAITIALQRWNGVDKDESEVDVPEWLSVNGSWYRLNVVVNHHGATRNEGHYTAITRSATSGQWQIRNDAMVSDADPREAAESRNRGYLFTFERVDNPDDGPDAAAAAAAARIGAAPAPVPGAPSSAAATNGVTEPESRAPADRLGAYSPSNDASEETQGPQAPRASGAPAALDGDVTIPAPIDALVRTLVAKSRAWSSPRAQADKREAIALVTELLQQLGMDAKVVDRGEQGKDAPDDEHSACTCVR
ncbi:hypothetical protein [Sorangium sp. So ce1389]|uniref:hypothetical protein n=1 Tax=Sorangium sp. So ce1389 TaxID=3133336 RepID=UPI003F60655B